MEAVGVSSAKDFSGLLFTFNDRNLKGRLVLKKRDNHGIYSSNPIPLTIKTSSGVAETIGHCHSFNVVSCQGNYMMSYKKKITVGEKTIVAFSRDGLDWKIQPTTRVLKETLLPLGRFVFKTKTLAYTPDFKLATTNTFKLWLISELEIGASLKHLIPHTAKIIGVSRIAEGILIIFESIHKTAKVQELSVSALLCSVFQPNKVTWVSSAPLFREEISPKDKIQTLGLITEGSSISLFWKIGVDILYVDLPEIFHHSSEVGKTRLYKHEANPIITPSQENKWESDSTFNPAAIHLADRVHLFYRAVSGDGISRIGYASSPDGIRFDDRLPYPAYSPANSFRSGKLFNKRAWNFPSGGGWGGSEDPRAVLIDDVVYVSFSAFDGWDFVRLAVISISKKDLLAKNFSAWQGPTFISPPGQIHKNWVIFPEKINGKFAILHSITPNVEIDYKDSIEGIGTIEPFIKSWNGPRDRCDNTRIGFWDNKLRGSGPPPIKTKLGWLLLYHAIDLREPSKYKLGAMILDLNDPTKILFRTRRPILVPSESYENDGKPGVVYACGAIIKDDTLHVYYGGADKVVCVAKAPMPEFLYNLEYDKPVSLIFKKVMIR